ncbi:MAG TPA: hypothetical protein VNP97_04695 [Microbacterium sp.]|nr:hypothetical protein [Microbacterium sp.]
MLPRVAAVALALALVIGVATGCQPQPEPSVSAPAFTTEEEAFAAAEETYSAYVDALNQVDLSDPETFEAVYAWTTGDLNATDRKGLSNYHADDVTVSGDSVVILVEPLTFDQAAASIELAACLDVSQVEVVDTEGTSLVDPDRIAVQSLLVTLDRDEDSPTQLLVASIGPREGGPLCMP